MTRFTCPLLMSLMLLGCGGGVSDEPMMPTPALYASLGVDPLADVPEDERWVPREVFYATVRARDESIQHVSYTNEPTSRIAVGTALIGFGTPALSWDELDAVSTRGGRDEPVMLRLRGTIELGQFDQTETPEEVKHPKHAGLFLDRLSERIEASRDKDIVIWVHGARGNFYNVAAFAGQFDHFMGRDVTSLAFSWPTHQEILSYGVGIDKRRAYDAAGGLATLIEVLAEDTPARKIHVVTWSAGGRLTTAALADLHRRHTDLTAAEMREQLRIGTVYYAGADVPRSEFAAALPAIHEVAERTIVTMSDDDAALRAARWFMGGGARLGDAAVEIDPGVARQFESLNRLELVDVSEGHAERGFDINSHHYWHDHAWASTDLILAIRRQLAAEDRGLVPGSEPNHYILPKDYLERLQSVVAD